MVIASRACPYCSDPVPPGRLSCPHCGAVLAAVANRVAVSATVESRAPAKRPTRAKRGSSAAPRKQVVTDDGWDADPNDAVQPEPIEPASPEPAAQRSRRGGAHWVAAGRRSRDASAAHARRAGAAGSGRRGAQPVGSRPIRPN